VAAARTARIDGALTRQLLRDLVAIDSVNSTLVPGASGEAAAAQFLEKFLRRHGIEAELEEAAPDRPNVVALLIAAVVDEECNSLGTEALLQRYTANAAVVLEPTDLRLVIAHKGYAWFEVVTHGRSAHGSLPAEGRDAIRMMGRVLNLLDALDRKLAALEPHPLLGHGSLHASLIRGGQELSSYPAQCRLQLERRTLPGESAAEIEAELRALISGLETRDADFHATARGLAFRPPYEISREAPLAQLVGNAIHTTIGSLELAGMAAWTDTALLAAAGIPGVVFGPSGKGLHGSEEYVEVESVLKCAEVLHEVIEASCG
jgi:acetylornithine deacetylase